MTAARWHDEHPAGEVLVAIPDEATEENHLELKDSSILGSLIASMRLDSKEIGLTRFPKEIGRLSRFLFFAFRVMVGCGLLMMALAWLGTFHLVIDRKKGERLLLWATFLSFPLPFIATLTGWFTAEVGRQPWSVYGARREAGLGRLVVCDATLWSSTAGGLQGLQAFCKNVIEAELPVLPEILGETSPYRLCAEN